MTLDVWVCKYRSARGQAFDWCTSKSRYACKMPCSGWLHPFRLHKGLPRKLHSIGVLVLRTGYGIRQGRAFAITANGSKTAVMIIQYPALSLRVRSPTKSPPHLHQPLNHQIQLGNFNIWAGYLVVYDL